MKLLVDQMPGSFPQLQALSDPNPDQDFFLNVAHLQMHRRARALHRISSVRPVPSLTHVHAQVHRNLYT